MRSISAMVSARIECASSSVAMTARSARMPSCSFPPYVSSVSPTAVWPMFGIQKLRFFSSRPLIWGFCWGPGRFEMAIVLWALLRIFRSRLSGKRHATVFMIQ
uniref:(northern house mosquito) hypothetical protein n=1 Tax=Culex pipiens TaxID=7175 RepID=A0A8D8DHL3_CULPI